IRQAAIDAGGVSDTVLCKIVSASYFRVLGMNPVRGRLLRDDDDVQPVAVISDRYWQRAFAGSDSVVGRQVTIDGALITIVGFVPPQFVSESVGDLPDLWSSVNLETAQRRNERGFVWLNLMGRLKPGRTLGQAAAELSAIASQSGAEIAPRIAVESG